MKKLMLVLLLTASSPTVSAETCGQIAHTAGLITNYRMSEGHDKTVKDFEHWWISQTDSNIPPKYFAIAQWVWSNELTDPYEARDKYYSICSNKRK